SGTKVVAEKPGPIDPRDFARVLDDVQQAATEHRQTPGLARLEEPRSGNLLVAFGAQVHPQEMSQLSQAQVRAIDCEQRASINAHRLLMAAERFVPLTNLAPHYLAGRHVHAGKRRVGFV